VIKKREEANDKISNDRVEAIWQRKLQEKEALTERIDRRRNKGELTPERCVSDLVTSFLIPEVERASLRDQGEFGIDFPHRKKEEKRKEMRPCLHSHILLPCVIPVKLRQGRFLLAAHKSIFEKLDQNDKANLDSGLPKLGDDDFVAAHPAGGEEEEPKL
jgi:hypothetical protein